MALRGVEQVLIYNEGKVFAPSGFNNVFPYGQQIILATDAAMAEATRPAEELKDKHGTTIKRGVEDLLPEQLYGLFAQDWQPEE